MAIAFICGMNDCNKHKGRWPPDETGDSVSAAGASSLMG